MSYIDQLAAKRKKEREKEGNTVRTYVVGSDGTSREVTNPGSNKAAGKDDDEGDKKKSSSGSKATTASRSGSYIDQIAEKRRQEREQDGYTVTTYDGKTGRKIGSEHREYSEPTRHALEDAATDIALRNAASDMYEKYGDRTYREIENATSFGDKWNNFWEQAKANKDSMRLNIEASEAMAKYASDPTEENKQRAQALRELRNQFNQRNAGLLDDEGAVLPLFSQNAAGYIPQAWDQAKGFAAGGGAGAAVGAAIGGIIGNGPGAVTGAKIGGKIGGSLGSGASMYDDIKGTAIEGFMDAGVDLETAAKAANQEAVLSSLVESVETGVDIATWGTSKWARLFLSYLQNVGSEGVEEGVQQGINIANIERIARGEDPTMLGLVGESANVLWDAALGRNPDHRAEIWDATKEGMETAAVVGGVQRVGGYMADRAASRFVSQEPASVDTAVETVDDPLRRAAQEAAEMETTETAPETEPSAPQTGETRMDEEKTPIREEKPVTGDFEAPVEPARASRNLLAREARDADMGDEGVKAIGEFYDESESPKLSPYFDGFQRSYEAGRSGRAFEDLAAEPDVTVSDRVKRAAWNAGRLDALAAGVDLNENVDAVNADVDTPEVTPTEYTNKTTDTTTVAENETVNADNALDNTTPVLEDVVTEQEPQYTESEQAAEPAPAAETQQKPKPAAKKAAAKKTKAIRTKKSDWSAHDVIWTVPSQKSPIAYSTKATSDTISVMADNNPTATISQLQGMITYDQEAKKVLQQYIDAGHGDQVANEWFSYDGQRKNGTTKWTTGVREPAAAETKEEVNNGTETVAEVPDSTGDGQSDTAGHDTGDVLDGVAAEDVRTDEEEGNAAGDTAGRGDAPERAADRPDTSGDAAGRSVGSGEGTDLQSASGEVTEAPKAHVPLNTDAELDKVLERGPGVEGGLQRVLDFYRDKNPTAAEAVEFLKKEYGIGGSTHYLTDGTRAHAMWNAQGIELNVWGSGKHRFKWAQIDKRLRKLVAEGKYHTTETKAEAKTETITEAINEETTGPETVDETVTEAEIAETTELGSQEQPKGMNYVIGEKGQKMPTTPKARYKANADAIKTLRTIMAEGRMATPEEQAVLAKYTGWGGLSDVFDERKADWAKEYKQLRKLLDDGEYKTAKGSILDAYYTEPGIIRGMYNGLRKLGFTGGRLLEPSAGVGRFIGAMPKELMGGVKSWTAVELDKITGNIAKYLYPNADVRVQGYETALIPDSYMDVVIGNVPFGNIPIADKAYPAAVTKSIHNYFIAKSLDKLRPGGILTVITSRETMDSRSDGARSYFMKQADLIGAIRLPNTAFQGTGTNVVSDILVFKKREAGTAYKGEAFTTAEYRYIHDSNVYAVTNEYFEKHPEMVLGKPKNTGGRYGETLTYDPLDSKLSLEKQIEKAFGKIKAKMDYPVQRTQEEIRAEIRAAAGKTKAGGIIKRDGKLYKNVDGQMVEATGIAAKDTERMGAIIEIRDAARALLDLQLDGADDKAIAAARKKLNALYDTFVGKNGSLNQDKNRKLAHNDADAPFILALEEYNKDTKVAKKAAIFTKNTVKANVTVTHADTVEEAITVALNESGTLDAARIAQLTGQTAAQVEREMLDRGLAFRNRSGDLETAEQYLSGNVRAKLRDAEALAEGDPDYKRNVEALRKVIPEDIPAEEIKVRLGATWVPDSVYSAFASEMLGSGMTWRSGQRVPGIEVTYNRPLGKFFIEINDTWARSRPDNTTAWGTEDIPFVGGRTSILDAALNNKTVAVYRTSGETRVLDKQATAAAQEKLEKVLAEFQSWIWKDDGRKTELGTMYNEVFNNTVTPKYDGSHLTVNGSNPAMEMRPHQKNAVQRIINSGGNTLLAHRVGAGKTYEMAAAAMKLRQLGIVKKPMFAVPKHLVAQWGNEFLSYFPAAKILVLGEKDFTPANRKIFANRIATGDYDAVIMSYEQMGMVPMSQASQEAFYQEQIDALEMAILESKRQSGKRDPSIRDMERTKKTFETKLKKLGDGKKDKDNIDFEQLGIDALFVDEAHNFKNLFYTTKMQGVADLGDKDGSQRAFDLYMKVRYLQRLNGGRGIVFATATPVMNSVVELYTMQRYLQGDLLEARGLSNFDAWANQFGDVVTIRKMKTGGQGYELKQSLSKYKNLGEMQQMFRAFADVITDPKDLPYLKIPTMKTGKRIVVECDPSDFQERFMEDLGKRADALRGAGKGGKEDHIFKVFDDGKKISYTQRMIDSSLPYEDGGKILRCVANVFDVWQRTKDNKGTQLIFCDRGTPGGAEAERGVSLYEDIRDLLVAQGIPEKEIAFIHDATDNDLKAKLFKDVNNGDVRVLIGSTAKMGTGMNAQKRIAALHELNAPDRPGDLEQNEGRGLRQGNMYDEVEVYAYVTKKTFDSRQWDNLKRKATFIHQIMAGEYNGREADGDGDLALSAAEISAIASDNPLIMEQFEVSEKIANLENLARAHTREVADAKIRIAKAEQEIATHTEYLARYKADLQARQDTAGDKFKAVVDGKTYKERKAAGEALIAAVKKHIDIKAEAEVNTKVGSFAGFELLVTSKGDVLLRGKAQYRGKINLQNPVGTIQSLEAIPKRLENMIANLEKNLGENRAAIIKLQAVAASSFARQDELVSARVREAEILQELNPPAEQQAAAYDDDGSADDVDNMAMPTVDRKDQWTTTRVGDKNKRPRPLSLIVADIRAEYGINITVGHIRGGRNVLGQYNKVNKGIRARIANDLPTIAHELGHHLDNVHGLTKGLSQELKDELTNGLGENMKAAYAEKKWVTEGLAEYVRKFLQNRETAAIDYPEFTKHFLNKLTGKDQALINVFADEINAYYSLDADTATSSVRLREDGVPDVRSNAEQWKDTASSLYQAWQDALHGIRLFDRATGADTYKLASNAAYSDSVARNIIFNELRDINGQYVGPGLKATLHGLNMGDRKEYTAFGEYLIVKHGPERLAEGMRVFADDRKNSRQFMERRQAELEQQYPAFAEISDRLYKFIEDLYETWGVETGLIGNETFKDWRERWTYYVPFNRVIEKRGRGGRRGLANQDSTVKKARGSGRDIYNPVDNLIENLLKLVNAGARNNAMLAITDAAQDLSANAIWLEKVPVPMEKQRFDMRGTKEQLVEQLQELGLSKKDLEAVEGVVADVDDILVQYKKQWGSKKSDVVTVMRDGKQEFWKINDPLLLESLTGMDSQKLKGVLDAYAVISRFRTSNITGNNIIWSIFSNAPRDLMTTLFYSKESNPVKILAGIGSAYMNKIKDSLGVGVDPLYQEYLALGGGNTSSISADRNLTKKVRKEMSRKISLNPLDWISYVSDVVESGPRFATYKLSRQRGMDPQSAFYAAMDVTVNFRRGGRYSREVNKAVPFFNANLQGVDKFTRWITAEDYMGEQRKKAIWGRAELWIAGSAILAAIAFAVNHGSDEDEENYERLSTFTKNSYWNFPLGDGKYFAIPKPRELAVLSSFMEATLSYGLGQNEYAYQEFYTYAVENFLPSIVSDAAQIPVDGIKEAAAGAIGSLGMIGVFAYLNANRDFLGRPIVSAGLEGLLPRDQYNDRTSKMAYWLGQAFDASPQEIDYFCEQVLGGWWKHQRALWPVGENSKDNSLGIKNTFVKDSMYSTDTVNWLYDQADLSSKEKRSHPEDVEKAIDAKLDDNMKQFYSRYYAQAKNTTETEKNRALRGTVLQMVEEYRKAKDHGVRTDAEEAVYAVCEEAGTTDFLPAVMQSAIKDGYGEEHQLSAIQYVEYQLDYNTLYWEYVEDNLDTSASHRKQAAILNAAKKIAAEQALNNALGRIGEKKTDFATDYKGIDSSDLVQFTAGKVLGDADGSGSLSDAEIVDIILDMHLSDSDTYALYFTESSSKTARAAKAAGIDADTYLAAKIEMAGISADKDEDGKSISGSRRDKIETYLNSVCDDYKTYLWLLGTEYESVKKDADYIAFFGRQD